jgi:hypothetical protein
VKWHRLITILVTVFCGLVLCHSVALAVSKPYRDIVPRWLGGMADADVTITATPDSGDMGPPTGFTATYISDNTVQLDWTPGLHADNTSIRAKLGGYPNDTADGYLVFTGGGTSSNDTALDFDVLLGTVYYRAWSENSTAYSADYASAELENPHVANVSAFAAILATIWPAFVLLGVVGVGYIFRAGLFVILAGLGFVIFGFTLWATLSWLSIIMVIVGIILVWLGAKS